MVCEPWVSEASEHVATPATVGETAAQLAIVTVLSVKATVPVRAAPPVGTVTVAMNETVWSTVEVLFGEDEARVILELDAVMVSERLLPPGTKVKFASLP
jgi:hypothetical protein